MVDEIGSEDFVSAQDSPGNNPYMMQGYVKGYPLNALWGFKYAGVWHSVDEFNRNKITKAYAPPSTLNDGNIAGNLGTPRYYDINRDGVLSQDDLVYLGNADPILLRRSAEQFPLAQLPSGCLLHILYRRQDLQLFGDLYVGQ